MEQVTVLGAWLAGSEAAWQLARRGVPVRLVEMKPEKMSPAHKSEYFAELVCSNSLRSDELSNAVGLLKAEMRRMGSLIMEAADENRVAAGGALAVDRVGFLALSVNGYCRGDYGTQANNANAARARASELSELEVLAAIADVKSKYNVDESRMFLMGNSMGGYGTTFIACKYPGMFAAISPSPAFTTFGDPMVLGDTPIRVVADDGAFHTAINVVKEWKEKGLNISLRGVPGGAHNTAWSQVMDETLEFFANVK